MRAYYFGNMYLSSIQQGIQAAHATHELFNKYMPQPSTEGECCFDANTQSVQRTQDQEAGNQEMASYITERIPSLAECYTEASGKGGVQPALYGGITDG